MFHRATTPPPVPSTSPIAATRSNINFSSVVGVVRWGLIPHLASASAPRYLPTRTSPRPPCAPTAEQE